MLCQQAADELEATCSEGAGEEGLGEVQGEGGGYGSGYVWKCCRMFEDGR